MYQPANMVSYDGLYTAHCGEVLRLCGLLLANHHDAEEVAQEVFIKVFQEFQKTNQPQLMTWKPWIMRVSVNACRDRRRSGWWKWWRGTIDDSRMAETPTLMRTPEDVLLGREIELRIWRAFQQLSARQREVFALRYVEEWSTDEVAQMLGISSGSVKRYLFRAVQQLRGVLGERL